MNADDTSLRASLEAAVAELPSPSVRLDVLLERLGGHGMLMLTIPLTVVFLIPVSIPGVSTVFGAVILLIGIARLARRPLWLPAALQRRELPSDRLRPALQRGLGWLARIEKISRPERWQPLLAGGAVRVVNDLAFILGAVLLMAPFGFIPFSNTLPGIALLLFAVGLIQRDGVAIALGHLANLATIIYFGFLIGGGGLLAADLWKRFGG